MDPLIVPEEIVGDAAVALGDSLGAVAGTVLPIAAVILAITVGWRFARKFVRG